MEKYLDKCLASLMLPEKQMERLEVLVINDGSKDTSSEIAHGYEKKYPNTFRVIDKENGNYGSCVNRGLKEATGKYIKVLDADDCFVTENFQTFVDFLESANADMIVSDVIRCDSSQKTIAYLGYKLVKDKVFGFSDITNYDNIEMHALTYRTSILKEMNYIQTEGISYTDTEWSTLPMVYVKTIMYFDKPLYRYLVGRDGQTINPVVMAKNYKQLVLILKRIIPILYHKTDYDAFHYIDEKILASLDYLYSIVLTHYDCTDTTDLKSFDNWLREAFNTLYDKTNKIKPHKYIPYYYVNNWRKSNYMKVPSRPPFSLAHFLQMFSL